MADYKEGQIAGNTWNRFSGVAILNPRGGQPSVVCTEEQVIALAAGEVLRPVGSLGFTFNPFEEFALLDPRTNTPTGETATGAQVQQLVFSYVLHEAMKRDASVPVRDAGAIEPTVLSSTPALIVPAALETVVLVQPVPDAPAPPPA